MGETRLREIRDSLHENIAVCLDMTCFDASIARDPLREKVGEIAT